MKGIAVLFSGQGAQSPGMLREIYETCEASRSVFQTADRSLERSITELTFDGMQEDLNLTHNTQPCMLAADLAAYAALKERGVVPDAVAGFSLGEYAALVAAGSLSVNDAFPLIQKRADYMQEAVPVGEGAMAAIAGKTLDEVRAMCDAAEGYAVPANINCPGQIVISGRADAVRRIVEHAREEKIKAMLLPVSAPFHCELLKPAADRLAVELNGTELCDAAIPVYMNVDGQKESSAERIREKLVLQASSPVYWELTLRNMYDDGFRTFVECGPGKTLSGFVKKTFKGTEDVVVGNVFDLASLESTINQLMEK